jgi:hypothetical protein
VLFSPDNALIDQTIKDLTESSMKFKVEDLGDVKDFLGIKIRKQKDGSIEMSQPHLIESILKDLRFQSNTKSQPTPALSSKILQCDESGADTEGDFHYRSVIGKLNFLEKMTRPDLAYSVHQCARFSSCTKRSHERAVRHIGRYLQGTKEKGLIMRPDHTKAFECWVDSDFVGNWHPAHPQLDSMTSKSRSGWLVTYAGCLVTYSSKLQTLTALSTTEAEYIALSTALRDVIPLMELSAELYARGTKHNKIAPVIRCKVFEDNSGALEMAKLPKIRPRTKHINNYYHHFREHVERGDITLHYTPTGDQLADILTKPLPEADFFRHRLSIQGW